MGSEIIHSVTVGDKVQCKRLSYARTKLNINTEDKVLETRGDMSQKHMENMSPLSTLKSKRELQEVV